MKKRYHTVAMRRQTYERLKDYKMAGGTYDEVLNQLMDALPLEEVSEEVLKEHRRRLKSSDWVTLEEVRKALGDD